jgi:RNA methyltransferase, TrmH family
LQDLEKSKTRKQLQLAPVEGEKEIEMAMMAGIAFHSLFYIEGLANSKIIQALQKKHQDLDLLEIDKDLFAKISYRESTGGMMAIVKTKTPGLEDLHLKENPLILIIESVEKPGNLGAMLRTADAAAIDAVICCHIPTDIYNPNIIRASLGTVFTVPLAVSNNTETMAWLKKRSIKTFCTNLHKAKDYHLQDYTQACAIIVGTESTGVSDEWVKFADQNVKIPMLGKIDSMNVSVASAIMLYEAKRQRGF